MIKSSYGPTDPKKKKSTTTSNDVGGFDVDNSTNKATPKPHNPKVVNYGTGTASRTKIIGTDGSVTYEGKRHDNATKEAVRSATNKAQDTANRRKKNADYYNSTNAEKLKEKENLKGFLK